MRKIVKHIAQIPGWKTNRKILVIESDDWGSVRMSGKENFAKLLNLGIPVNNDLYNIYDALESNDDLIELFEVLLNFKDEFGNHPVITANTIVGNPDWDKIRNSNFETFYFEKFTQTLEGYDNSDQVYKLYKQGISDGIFFPQFHGREHLNARFWLNSLKSGDEFMLAGFEEKVFGIPLKNSNFRRKNFMASFDFEHERDFKQIAQSIEEGLSIFKELFGYTSKTLIAPCYVWSDVVNETSCKFGVEGIQGIKFQFKPMLNSNQYKKIYHYTGQKNKLNQTNLVRNVFFEPTHFFKNNDSYIEEIIAEIRLAFKYKNPAIVGAHRINFMGRMDRNNRTINLELLSKLLKRILQEFPDIEFMNSSQLLSTIQDDKK